jgi:hypothetical protein
MSTSETVLLKEQNMSGYSFAVLATFEEKLPVHYIIRINSPNGHKEDYVCNLECLTNIGELLTTLKCFAETDLYPEDSKKLRDILTAENLKSFEKVLKSNKMLDKSL